MASGHGQTAGVIAPPPAIFAAGLALGSLLQRIVPAPRLPGGVRRALGLPLVGLGLGLGVWAIRTMLQAGTPLEPSRPTTAIVSSGPYRLTRNPIYAGMAFLYTGLALVAGRLWALALLPGVLAVVQRGVIEREERYLEARFGDEYRAYRARVRRWL